MHPHAWLRFLQQWIKPNSPAPRRKRRSPRVEELEPRLLLASSLSISDASLVEGNSGQSNMLFTVARSGDLSTALAVTYATADGTATAGSDYVAQTGTLSFAPGATAATIAVPILGDTLHEPDETFTVTLTGIVGGSPLTFGSRQDFAIGSSQASIRMVTADFNGDGRPDFAAANRTTNSVGVLLNTTTPGASSASFAPAVQVPTANNPLRLAVGDLNGDGRPDIATANYSSSTVSVLLNTTAPGSSTAAFSAQSFASRQNPYGIAIGDLDGDGKPDLIVAHDFGAAISVFRNTTAPGAATASFDPRQDFPLTGARMQAVGVADVNGDGKLDVIAAWHDTSGGAHAVVLLNSTPAGSAAITFAARQDFTVPGGVHSVAVGDLNNDGRPDVGIAGLNTGAVALLVNTTPAGSSTVSFSIQQVNALGGSPTSVQFSDFNLDGKLDLGFPQVHSGVGTEAVVVPNTTPPGSTTLTFGSSQAVLTTLAGCRDVFGVDVNGDGRPDLAYVNLGPGLLSVHLSTSDLIVRATATGTIIDDDPTTLQVTTFTPTTTGFTVRFNQAIDTSTLNLYDTQAGSLGPADVTLTRNGSEAIRGTLVLASDNRGFTFIQTDAVLPDGSYSVRLRSAANGFKDTSGGLLDGNSDGTPGDDFTTTFNVAPAGTRIVSIPDFARGPGQAVNIPADGSGIPITLSDGTGVTSLVLMLRYDPTLLNITGAAPGSAAPAGATVDVGGTPGQLTLTYSAPTPLGGLGNVPVINLTAQVPADALYKAKDLLDLDNIRINNGAIAARANDGVHVVVFLGDATGNAGYNSTDAQRTLRVALGLDTGFPGLASVDPVVVADINGNGSLTSTDATRILQEVVGIPQPQIPPLPAGIEPTFAAGPDPTLSIPTNLRASPGGTITVPVNLDRSDGLETGDLALSYDTSRLEVRSMDDVRRGSLLGDFDLFLANPVQSAGTIRVAFGRTAGPISARGAGSVIQIVFHVKPDAPPGPAVINLRHDVATTVTQLNDGGLTLTPAPTNADTDSVDGRVTVETAPRVEGIVVNDGAAQHSLVNSLTVTFNKLVTLPRNPLTAFRLTGPKKVGLRATVGQDAGRTVVRLTFKNPSRRLRPIINGSLPDGVWTLTVRGDLIKDAIGTAVDGDNNGTPGGNAVDTFFRLFGDSNGDRKVDAAIDQAAFAAALGKRRTDPDFVPFFDYNGDGRINSKDNAAFLRRLGRMV